MPRILLTAAVALAAVVAVPTIAQGATIHQDGRTPQRILLQDATGEANLVSVEGSRSVVLHDTNVPIEIAGVPTCMALDPYTVSCSAVRRLEVDFGAGQDHLQVDSTLPVEVDGGAGNDRYNVTATGGPSRVKAGVSSPPWLGRTPLMVAVRAGIPTRTIAGAGHSPHLTHPAAFAEVIEAFARPGADGRRRALGSLRR